MKKAGLWIALLLVAVLAMTAVFAGCKNDTKKEESKTEATEGTEKATEGTEKATEDTEEATEPTEETEEVTEPEEESEDASIDPEEFTNVLGEGETRFFFIVTDKDGNQTKFQIFTDDNTVGEALLAHDLIAGDESDFGLYVKTVNGITADYEVDGTYWAFYVDGDYSMSGVDTTPAEPDRVYEFRVSE